MNQATADKLSQAINELNNLLQKQGVAAQPEGPAEILLSIVPIVGIIFGCTLLFFYLFWRYRQNKELIRTGKYEATTYANLRSWSLLMEKLLRSQKELCAVLSVQMEPESRL